MLNSLIIGVLSQSYIKLSNALVELMFLGSVYLSLISPSTFSNSTFLNAGLFFLIYLVASVFESL
jgi:hypothetical protein